MPLTDQQIEEIYASGVTVPHQLARRVEQEVSAPLLARIEELRHRLGLVTDTDPEFVAIAKLDALTAPVSEPVAWRGPNFSSNGQDYAYRDYDDPLLNVSGEIVGEKLFTPPQPCLRCSELEKENHELKQAWESAGITYRRLRDALIAVVGEFK